MLSLYVTLVESRGFEVFVAMENSDEHKTQVLYFFFNSEENGTKAAEKLNIVYGKKLINILEQR